jgi:hypothetical protein
LGSVSNRLSDAFPKLSDLWDGLERMSRKRLPTANRDSTALLTKSLHRPVPPPMQRLRKVATTSAGATQLLILAQPKSLQPRTHLVATKSKAGSCLGLLS